MKGCRDSDLDMEKIYYYNYFMDKDCYCFPNLIEHFETSNAIIVCTTSIYKLF